MWVFVVLIALLFVSPLYRTTVQPYEYSRIDKGNVCSCFAEEEGCAVGPRVFVLQVSCQFFHRLRKETGDQRYHAPMEKENISLLRLTIISCYRPFREWLRCALPCRSFSFSENQAEVLLYDRMVLLLDIWWVNLPHRVPEETQRNPFSGPL
jgi:hypothetical protein